MKRGIIAIAIAIAIVTIATTPLAAHQKGHGKGSAKQDVAVSDGAAGGGAHVSADIHFSIGEQRVIREYYAPRYRSLPPGLQKKVARGKPLPPGWQKKLQPFAPEVERRLSPLPAGYGRGVIDGHAVIYGSRSHAVVDVAVLF